MGTLGFARECIVFCFDNYKAPSCDYNRDNIDNGSEVEQIAEYLHVLFLEKTDKSEYQYTSQIIYP